MDKYIPFLKFKKNEVTAIKELPADLKEGMSPFFDFPRKQELTEEKFLKQVPDAVSDVGRHLSDINRFYLDNFDLDSTWVVAGADSYDFILRSFAGIPIIPVLGLDRTDSHIQAVDDAIQQGHVADDLVALRLLADDYEDYSVIELELKDLFDRTLSKFSQFDLVLDMRVLKAVDIPQHVSQIEIFLADFSQDYSVRRVILTGSVLPGSIADLVVPNTEITVERSELAVYEQIDAVISNEIDLWLGDYVVVSPDYSDVDMPPEMLRNITAPKLIYSYERFHWIKRGRALKQYGNQQYNDMSVDLVAKPYYRGRAYSWGDTYFDEKSQMIGSQVTPSTVVKPGVNAHISYMLRDY